MPFIPLGESDWVSDDVDITRIRVRNMYLVEDPQSPDGVTRVTRPSLDAFTTVGPSAGPITGIFRKEGVLGGDIFLVSGSFLYRLDYESLVTEGLAYLPGTGICQFTATTDKLIIVRDGTPYYYDGVTLGTVGMPTGSAVISTANLNGYVLYALQDTDTFYWSVPGVIDPDGLDFATAERYSDYLVAIAVISDELWLLGKDGPEVWQATGDADAPFARIPGRVYDAGCLNVETVASVNANNLPGLIWVTDKRTVVLAQGGVNKISTESVDELLKTATNVRAWSFDHNKHSFYILTSDEFTLSFDITAARWYRWDSYGEVNFRAHLGTMYGSVVLGVDYKSNNIWTLGTEGNDDGIEIIREISGGVFITGKPMICNEVIVRVNSGANSSYTADNNLELRWSDDQGKSWVDYRQASLGSRGDYDHEVQFRSLGQIRRPGRLFELRYSGTSKLRIDYATMNEA